MPATMFVKIKVGDSKPDEVSEPTRPESDEKENHTGSTPSVDKSFINRALMKTRQKKYLKIKQTKLKYLKLETEKVEAKLKEVEALLAKVRDASLKDNVTESLAGLRNNLSLQTMDNNGIMAEAEKLLALLKR